MRVGAGTEFDFLDLDDLLFLARFGLALLRLIFIFTEIHDLAHRRFGIWRDFDQIKPGLFGHHHGARGRHDAYVLTVCPDQSNFRRPDSIIDAGAGFALRRGVVGSAGYGFSPCVVKNLRGWRGDKIDGVGPLFKA